MGRAGQHGIQQAPGDPAGWHNASWQWATPGSMGLGSSGQGWAAAQDWAARSTADQFQGRQSRVAQGKPRCSMGPGNAIQDQAV